MWSVADAIPLARGVASSCCVPGIFPPIEINGRRWMDGGMRSSTSADLAAAYERVLVVAVVAGGSGDPRLALLNARLERERATDRRVRRRERGDHARRRQPRGVRLQPDERFAPRRDRGGGLGARSPRKWSAWPRSGIDRPRFLWRCARMPRLEPIPMEKLTAGSRRIIEEGVAQGLYATPVPLQIFAYRTAQLEDVHRARTERGVSTLLGGRILELIRIRSAQPRRVPAVHAIAQARIDHGRGRGLPPAPRPRGPEPAGADGRGVHRSPVRGSPCHGRSLLSASRRGLHRGADHRARLHLRGGDGAAPVHPHSRRLGTSTPVIPYAADQVDTSKTDPEA